MSGTYVSRTAKSATLLQITETPDHHFTGTTRNVSLNNDGTLATSTANIAGSVDGTNLTLTVQATPFPVGQNFGGTVTSDGIDLTVAQGAQTAVEHFVKGETADFNAVVTQLNAAGAPVIAQRDRERRVQAMNVDVNSLLQDLVAFMTGAHQVIANTPTIVNYYPTAVTAETEKLERAQRLMRGSTYEQGQAQFLQGQMQFDQGKVQTVDGGITNATRKSQEREATLDAHIAKYQGTCLGDGATVKVGDVVPDQGSCKTLVNAVRAYRANVAALHQALASAASAKSDGDKKLAGIWKSAADMH
ncbi:hypothetical protein PQQ86_39135 [Paraburkholderia sediminicola]|uniref:hypothetical protein n=1 Tax=Paraburkholderia sediminicola TaxID=458836 RepID=UPI0038BBDCA2